MNPWPFIVFICLVMAWNGFIEQHKPATAQEQITTLQAKIDKLKQEAKP